MAEHLDHIFGDLQLAARHDAPFDVAEILRA
jgi:hypothetical protein